MTQPLNDVAAYYTAKLAEHGESARGVDWNGEESQTLRFVQLASVIDNDGFSVNDLGCGYGAMGEYLQRRFPNTHYIGYDIAPAMVEAAKARLPKMEFHVAAMPIKEADYGVASGIFNVRMMTDDATWLHHIEKTLDALNATSRKGFAFNCLTSYSDADKKRDYLYYADPAQLFDLCKRRYSKQVALLHDYGLYEFTIRVRR